MWSAIKEKHDILTLAVAVIAVVLSQFPPIYTIFDSEEIILNDINSLTFLPSLSDGFNIVHTVQSSNSGEKTGFIKGSRIYIFNSNQELVLNQKAVMYESKERDYFNNLALKEMENIVIGPLEPLSTKFLYKGYMSADDQLKMSNIRNRYQSENSKFGLSRDLNSSLMFSRDFEITDFLYSKTSSYIQNKTKWFIPGQYLILHILDLGDRSVEATYLMTISKSEVENLNFYILNMKDSNSIYPKGEIQVQIFPISDSEITKDMRQKMIIKNLLPTHEVMETIASSPAEIEAINVITDD